MSLPVLGPFPCGAAKCHCARGGCDHLGACPPAMVAALSLRSLECACGITWSDQDPRMPCEECGAVDWTDPEATTEPHGDALGERKMP